jgi:hypothetical protein
MAPFSETARPSSPFGLCRARFALLSRVACATRSQRRSVVGLGRLELPTSRLSSARSNQLSYKPQTTNVLLRKRPLKELEPARAQPTCAGCVAQATAPGACSSAKKEKRRRRNPANGAQRSGDRWPLMFQKRFDRARIRRSRLAEEPSLERR